MGMDPRGYGFHPGEYEYRHQENMRQHLASEMMPNSYRPPFFGSWLSVFLKALVMGIVIVVLVLATYVWFVPK